MRAPVLIVGMVLAVVAWINRERIKSIMISNEEALNNPDVGAFLKLIRRIEGLDSYTTLYHPPKTDPLYSPAAPLNFSGFESHPNIRIRFTNPKTGKNDYSTAAGGYQINRPTYLLLSAIPGSPSDFSPAAQDWFAVQLLRTSGALALLMKGDFEAAAEKASTVWAFLPSSTSKQVHISLARASELFQQFRSA